MSNPFRKFFKPGLELIRGTRFVSFLFIGISILIGAGILWAANLYYNIDTGQIVMEEVQNVTKDLIISGANQALKFTGGTNYFVGLQASTTVTSTKTYILPQHGIAPPSADYVLTWQSGDQLTWKMATSVAGVGDITDVGDVSSGAAFTSGGTGASLWFHSGAYTGQLTQGTLTGSRTYTLPDLTGTVALAQAGGLGTGPVLFGNNGLIATSSNFFWDISNGRLAIGTSTAGYPLDVLGAIRSGRTGTAGQIIISNNSGYGLIFQANASMVATNTYNWPVDYGTSNFVLTTNGSGGLSWQNVTGTGAVTGTGEANRLARWTSASNLATSSIVDNYTGTALTIGSTGTTTIAYNLIVSGSGGVTSALYTGTSAVTYTSGATTTISSAGSADIILDPASGKITLGTTDYIRTASGYEIGKVDTLILREMIPILGFDLPPQTASTSYVTISRTLENYPFVATTTGTTRVHKFVIRYVDDLPTASSSDWRIWNVTDSTTTASFTVAGCNETDFTTAKGKTQIVETSIPGGPGNNKSWRLDIKIPAAQSGKKIRVFEVFLAAYDKIQ